jgi:hypothetical protein
LAFNCCVSESTQNQALGAILFLFRHVLAKALGSLDALPATDEAFAECAMSNKLSHIIAT